MSVVPSTSRRTSEEDLQTTQPGSTPKSDPATNVLGQISLSAANVLALTLLFFGLKGKCWIVEDRTLVAIILKDPHQHSLPQENKSFPVASASLFCSFLNRQFIPENMISRVYSFIWACIHNSGNSPDIKMMFKRHGEASTWQGTSHKAVLKSMWVIELRWFGVERDLLNSQCFPNFKPWLIKTP